MTPIHSDTQHRSEIPRPVAPCRPLWPADKTHLELPPPAGPDPAAFRRALGCFASGVTVVTAGTDDGEVAGLTANAFTSVSLDPPLVLVCVRHGSYTGALLRRSGRFAVHMLRADQGETALACARSGADKLEGLELTRSVRGIPTLRRYLALLECTLEAEYGGGDHAIYLGRVLGLDVGPAPLEPLTYFQGRLGALGPAAS